MALTTTSDWPKSWRPCSAIGDVTGGGGNLADGLAAYRQSLDIHETLAARDPANMRRQREPVVSSGKTGYLLLQLGRLDEAREAVSAALRLTALRPHDFPQAHYIAEDLAAAQSLLRQISNGTPHQPVPRPPVPCQVAPDPRAEAHTALAQEHPAEALAIIAEVPDDDRTRNLRAVCLLRLHRPGDALEALPPAVVPAGGPTPEDTTPDTWIRNYATAQFPAGDPRASRRSLAWVKNTLATAAPPACARRSMPGTARPARAARHCGRLCPTRPESCNGPWLANSSGSCHG